MALRYKVLERFSEEARRKVAERVFNRPRHKDIGEFGVLRYYACEQGDCIFAALLKADGIPLQSHAPQDETVARKLGIAGGYQLLQIGNIMRINDEGLLATPAAVRALLLGDDAPAGAASGGEGVQT